MTNHLAIIRPPSLAKILCGAKTIESRFSIQRPSAWHCEPGDTIYFKARGGDILCRARAEAVDRHVLEDPGDLLYLEPRYWRGVHGHERNISYWLSAIRRGVRYAVFIHLANIEPLWIPAATLPRNLPYASAWIRNFTPPAPRQAPLIAPVRR